MRWRIIVDAVADIVVVIVGLPIAAAIVVLAGMAATGRGRRVIVAMVGRAMDIGGRG